MSAISNQSAVIQTHPMQHAGIMKMQVLPALNVRDLVRASQVCKGWQAMITTIPDFVTQVATEKAKVEFERMKREAALAQSAIRRELRVSSSFWFSMQFDLFS